MRATQSTHRSLLLFTCCLLEAHIAGRARPDQAYRASLWFDHGLGLLVGLQRFVLARGPLTNLMPCGIWLKNGAKKYLLLRVV